MVMDDDRQTKIPDLLYDIKTAHHEKLEQVLQWMQSHGADLWNNAETDAWRADFNVTIKHENEYIECGGAIPDPNFEHYYIFSWAEIEVRVPLNSLQHFLNSCDLYKYWSDVKWGYPFFLQDGDSQVGTDLYHQQQMEEMKQGIKDMKAEGIYLETNTDNQYTMEERIHFCDYSHKYCEIRLEWRVYHTFNDR
jgi:hypothetical protein